MERLELKNKLKDWENAYKIIHGKKPTKSDVDVAPAEIRGFYNEYWKKSTKQILSVIPKPSKSNTDPTGVRLKRCDSFSEKLLPRQRNSLEMSTVSSMSEQFSSSMQKDTKRFLDPDKREPTNFAALEHFRFDKTFRIESIGGFHPNVQSSSKCRPTRKDLDEDSLSQLLDEVDFRKRQNLCKFSFEFDAKADDNEPEPSNETFMDETDLGAEQDANASSDVNLIGSKKRKKRQKSNENFLRLDLKHKRYGSRAGKKLKGAALKRLLLKMKYKKLRKTS